MTDERVRALERRFQTTHALGDEVALLAARLQAGDLSPRHLEVAYLCGHPAARALGCTRPLVRKSQIISLFKFTPGNLNGWVHLGCPRTKRAGTWLYDLASLLEWCGTEPPTKSQPDWTLVGNLVRASGREDPFAAYRGGLAALQAALEERPRTTREIEVASRVSETAEQWLADPSEWSNLDQVLDGLSGAGNILDLTGPAIRVLEAIRTNHDKFEAPGLDYGHYQIRAMGEVVDQLVFAGAIQLSLEEWPDPADVRAYDEHLTKAVAPALATWALSRPSVSSPRPGD